MNTVGRKPFVFDAINDFLAQNSHMDFADRSTMDAYRCYVDWASAMGKKEMSYVSFSHTFKAPEAPVKKENLLSLEEQFSLFKQYIGLVNDGIIKALYSFGEPGIGKTYTVEEVLPKSNPKYKYFSGGVKGSYELAKILYQNKDDKVIILDDFDSVFKTRTQIDILKVALQNKPTRTITWIDGTKRTKGDKLPESFEFTSSVIFISNKSRLDPAIQSRCKIMEFNTTKVQILDYIKSKFNVFMKNIPLNVRMEVYNFFIQNIASFPRVDFRLFYNVSIDCFLDYRDNRKDGHWKLVALNNTL
jgi:replication-associated recombination protein RarA